MLRYVKFLPRRLSAFKFPLRPIFLQQKRTFNDYRTNYENRTHDERRKRKSFPFVHLIYVVTALGLWYFQETLHYYFLNRLEDRITSLFYSEKMFYHVVLGSIPFRSIAKLYGIPDDDLNCLQGMFAVPLKKLDEIITELLKRDDLNSSYRNFLIKFQKDLKRSIPHSTMLFFNSHATKKLQKYTPKKAIKKITQDVEKDLRNMKPNEHIILPILHSRHCTYAVLEKCENDHVKLRLYDTGDPRIWEIDQGFFASIERLLAPSNRGYTDREYPILTIEELCKGLPGLFKLTTVTKPNISIFDYCEKQFGPGRVGDKMHKLQLDGTCAWEPLEKIVAHLTSYENRWRFKVDVRDYVLQNFLLDSRMRAIPPENRRVLYDLMKLYGIKIVEKNKYKLSLIEKRSKRKYY